MSDCEGLLEAMGWSRAEGIVWAREGSSEGGEHHAEGLREESTMWKG